MCILYTTNNIFESEGNKVEGKIKKQVLFYLVFTFFVTWMIWSLAYRGLSSSSVIPLGTFVPSFAGLIFTIFYGGKEGLIEILKSTVQVRFKLKWYLYIFTIMPLVVAGSFVILKLLGSTTPVSEFPIWAIPIAFVYILLTMGPLGEEIGWRGFMLFRILKFISPLKASIILGFVWSVWHLPLFFIDGTIQSQLANNGFFIAFFCYALYTILITIHMTLLYINTQGSIFAAILFHTVSNLSLGVAPVILTKTGAIVLLGLLALTTTIVVIKNSKRLCKTNYESYV